MCVTRNNITVLGAKKTKLEHRGGNWWEKNGINKIEKNLQIYP